jgi:hypothetical protein
LTWVPPSMVKVEGEGAHIITGRTACTTNAQLPWLPMSTLCASYAWTVLRGCSQPEVAAADAGRHEVNTRRLKRRAIH